MKVTFVCVSLRPGGTERIISLLASSLREKYSITIVLLSSAPIFYNIPAGVNVVSPDISSRSNTGLTWYPKIFFFLMRTLHSVKPNLVLSFGETISPFVVLASKIMGAKVIVFNRANPYSSLTGVRGFLNPVLFTLAECVVVQTQRAVDILSKRYRFVKFSVMPNPVEVPKEVKPIEQRGKSIINVGMLGGLKNQRALISAFANTSGTREWRLVLVGDGPDRGALQQLCKDLRVDDYVDFLGERNDVFALLQNSRIFVFSSLSEGFPNALLEALAAGCACISFDCPTGPSELIVNNFNGLLVENANEEALLCQLDALMQNDEVQTRLAKSAREKITIYSRDRVIDDLERLLEHTCNSRSNGESV